MKKNLLLLAFFTSMSSFACSCHEVKIRKSYKEADLVFTGEVLDVKEIKLKHKFISDGKEQFFESDKHEYTFEIKAIYKGKQILKKVKISTDPDEAACGYRFEKGKTYLVYSYRTDFEVNSDLVGENKVEKPFYTTHLCTRTTTIILVKNKEFRKLARFKKRHYKI